MLASPAGTPAKRFPTVDTNMRTVPTPATAAESDAGRDTVMAEPDDVHSLPTVADEPAPELLELGVTAARESTPSSSALMAPADLIEDTETQTALGGEVPAGVADTSPFSEAPGEDTDDDDDSDVLTKTVVEEEAVQAPPAGKLPPLPVPRTPVPIVPPPARQPGLPPRPNSSSSAPPIPGDASSSAKATGAPPIPGSVASKASSSGVLTSAMPHAASTPASGRPSDVLPRPPPSAVVRPGQPAGASPPIPEVAASAMMMESHPTPSHLATPAQPANMAAGMQQSPAPPAGAASMPSPAPHAGPAGMADMPAAYALPGAGESRAASPMATGAPLVHTPIPPEIIGPPPDLNEAPSLGGALDGLDQEMAGSHTPSGNAVWRTAHPSAQKWAARRHGSAVRTPKPGIIAIGLMLTGFGAYLLAIFLPTKQPLTAAKIEEISRQAGVDENAWRFSEQLLDAANVNAGLFALLGIVIVLRGALFRQQPSGRERGRIGKPALMLIACFLLLAVSFAALLITASA